MNDDERNRSVFLAELCLGYTRLVGCLVYSPQTREFNEITTAAARRALKKGDILGVKWKDGTDGGEFIPDEGFGMTNLLIKSGVGKYRPLYNDIPGEPVNSMYVVTRVLDTDYRGRLYEVVNQRCQRVKLEAEQLRKLAEITQVAGVRITDESIEVLDGIIYEDRRKKAGGDIVPVSNEDNEDEQEEKQVSVKKTASTKNTKKTSSAAAKKRTAPAKKK